MRSGMTRPGAAITRNRNELASAPVATAAVPPPVYVGSSPWWRHGHGSCARRGTSCRPATRPAGWRGRSAALACPAWRIWRVDAGQRAVRRRRAEHHAMRREAGELGLEVRDQDHPIFQVVDLVVLLQARRDFPHAAVLRHGRSSRRIICHYRIALPSSSHLQC